MKKVIFTLLCIALIFSIVLIMTGREDPPAAEKPVIYLYPEETMEATVKLDYNGEITKSILICFGKAIAILNMI